MVSFYDSEVKMTSAKVISEMQQANSSICWRVCHLGGRGGGGWLTWPQQVWNFVLSQVIANQKGHDDPLTFSSPSHYHMQWYFPIVTPQPYSQVLTTRIDRHDLSLSKASVTILWHWHSTLNDNRKGNFGTFRESNLKMSRWHSLTHLV